MTYGDYQLTSSVQGLMEQNQALTAQIDALHRQLDTMRQAGIAAQVNRAIAEAVADFPYPVSEADRRAYCASIAARTASDERALDKIMAGDISGAVRPYIEQERENFMGQLRDRFFDEAAFQAACDVAKMTGKPGF